MVVAGVSGYIEICIADVIDKADPLRGKGLGWLNRDAVEVCPGKYV